MDDAWNQNEKLFRLTAGSVMEMVIAYHSSCSSIESKILIDNAFSLPFHPFQSRPQFVIFWTPIDNLSYPHLLAMYREGCFQML